MLLKTTTSSPCPSPPKEVRETAPRPVNTKLRLRCSGDGRAPVRLPRYGAHRAWAGGGTEIMIELTFDAT